MIRTKTGKIIFGSICIIVAIFAIVVLLIAINTNRKSEKEVESIDAFIVSQEALKSTRSSQNEITDKISEETTEAQTEANKGVKSDDGYRGDSGSTDSSRDNTDSGADNDYDNLVGKVSVEELAEIIINQGINGDERIAYLGNRYDEVQKWIEDNYEPPTVAYYEEAQDNYYSYPQGSGVLTPDSGVNNYYGITETYYNLDMSGVVDWMHSLGYGGEYWVRGDGVKMLGDYVMVAADYGWMPKGSIVETSLGTGIVCDTGLGGWYWYDIAVAW